VQIATAADISSDGGSIHIKPDAGKAVFIDYFTGNAQVIH
jgi:hypothetical protein